MVADSVMHDAVMLHLVLSDWIGRKLAIMVGGAIFLVGGILQASAVFLWYDNYTPIEKVSH